MLKEDGERMVNYENHSQRGAVLWKGFSRWKGGFRLNYSNPTAGREKKKERNLKRAAAVLQVTVSGAPGGREAARDGGQDGALGPAARLRGVPGRARLSRRFVGSLMIDIFIC